MDIRTRTSPNNPPNEAVIPDGSIDDENNSIDQFLEPDDSIDFEPSHIVGIGASAGGLNALQLMFDAIPDDTGAAFVVVQHLSPDFKTLMGELLAKHTDMPVKLADDGEIVRANYVYVMRPKHNLIIAEGRLWLTEADRSEPVNLTINDFFQSLADDCQNRAIGVILSGTGSDGSRGLQALKGVGGLVMVQEPEEAEFDGMPMSAINTGQVDVVGPIYELTPQLVSYIQHPISAGKDQAFKEHLAQHVDLLTTIFVRLKESTSIDFAVYKPSTVARRIEHRMGINNVKTLPDYYQILEKQPREFELLKNDLLIGVTEFFRDPSAFQTLADSVISEIVANKESGTPIRVWMAGVSSGEEAYSIAMLLVEEMDRQQRIHPVKIFASDVDGSAIAFASAGVYPRSIQSEVSPERLSRFFTVDEQYNYVVCKQLRQMIVFATHNVIQDPPFSNMDLVVCRNMLIYLKNPAQERALALMHFALRKGGYLFLGSSESLGAQKSYFKPLSATDKIYCKIKTNRLPVAQLNPESIHSSKNLKMSSEANNSALLNNVQQRHKLLLKGSKRNLHHAARDRLLNLYAPPGMLLDSDKNVMQIYGDCADYMRKQSQGRITTYFDALIQDDLAVPMSSGIAKISDGTISNHQMRNVPLKLDTDDRILINLTFNRLGEVGQSTEPHFYISFEKVDKSPDAATDPQSVENFTIEAHTRERLRELDIQLLDSKEELREAYAELDTTGEELQSTNEELMAANEELQSTNEELQSVNEELYTVNNEYQEKIVELTDLNSDLDNLLNSTGFAIVFLDSTLSIRRYTASVKKYISLLPSDVDRPISDFTLGFMHPEFHSDLNKVLSSGNTVERKVKVDEKSAGKFGCNSVHLTISPYISSDRSINGVVLSIRND